MQHSYFGRDPAAGEAEPPRGNPLADPRWAVIGIFLILAFSAIAAARDFLMPTTMAVLLFFVFAPLRRSLERIGVAPWISATLVTLGLLAAIFGMVVIVSGPAGELINDMPRISAQLEDKMESLRGSMRDIQQAVERIDEISEGQAPGRIRAETDDGSIANDILAMTPALAGQLIFILVLLFFMIASGDLLYLKIVQSFPSLGEKRRAYAAMREIEASLGSYLGTITLINAGLGLAIGLAMWFWGMPAPALFGVMAFALNYIPYLGLIAGAAIATVVALVSMDGFAEPIMVGLTYVALSSVEGQLVTPVFVSRKLQMNTVVVFLSVALWAWLWSIVGMIVAVPLLVVLRVLCAHIPGMERLGNFLGGEDPAPLGPEEAQATEGAEG